MSIEVRLVALAAEADSRTFTLLNHEISQTVPPAAYEEIESVEVFAWVLMTNHYHLAFKTPEPNLVEGMKWFQNTWTKRFNARHRLWGHLYGGRYKAALVEEGEHLGTLIDHSVSIPSGPG